MKTNRPITKKECPWLDRDIPEGTEVYPYRGHTYGCITSMGYAVTFKPNTTPFVELPAEALTK